MSSSFKIFVFLTGLVLGLTACDRTVPSPYDDISFVQVPAMNDKARSSAVGFAVDGKGYVALGRANRRNGGLKDCWEFNPVVNTWTRKSDFPGKPRVNAVAIGLDTVAYVGLGFNVDEYDFFAPGGLFRDFWCYHPSTDTWVKKDTFPSTFTDAPVSFYREGYIYVACGFHNTFSAEMWKYSVATDKWVRLKDFPGGFRACAVVSADDQHIYMGTGYNTYNLNDWWEYFPAEDRWEKRKAMPDNGRQNATSLAINHRYFVSTGQNFDGSLTGGHLKADVMEYDPVKDVWYARGNIPGGVRKNAVSFVAGGKAYIGFGENDKQLLNDFWAFEP